MVSHVILKLVYMFRYPPRMGAMMQPTAYAVLKTPAALSFIVPEWITPSEVRTPSIISESKGTKIMEQAQPSKARPHADNVKVI